MRTARLALFAVIATFLVLSIGVASMLTENSTYRIWRGAVDSGDTARPIAPLAGRRLIPNVAEPVCSADALINAQYRLHVGLFFARFADCNTNGIADNLDIAQGTSTDCNSNGVPDECEALADCNTNGMPDVCEASTPCGLGLPPTLVCQPLCNPSTTSQPVLLSFDSMSSECACWDFELFAGHACPSQQCNIWRILRGCSQQAFGQDLADPQSVLVDVNRYWPSICPDGPPIIVGGHNIIYFLNQTGSICAQFPNNSLGHVGQMALDSTGRLIIGTMDENCVHILTGDALSTCFCCPNGAGSPSAVVLDAPGNIYVVCSGDGVMRKLPPTCTLINPVFADGLQGAVSAALAPPGIFGGNLFVACGPPGNRIVQVDRLTGQSSVFACNVEPSGIAFDANFMYVSIPSQDRILRIGPALPGDMDFDGTVTLADLPGFVKALLCAADAPRPILAADMNDDGCANGDDVQIFVNMIIP